MEVAIEAPLTIVYEPLFAEDVAEDVAYAGATPASRFDASARAAAAAAAAAESDWESDDDVARGAGSAERARRGPDAGGDRRVRAPGRRGEARGEVRGAGGGQDGGGRVQDGGGRVRAVGDAQGGDGGVLRPVALHRREAGARGRGLPRALAEHAEEAAHAEVRRRPRRRGFGPRRLPTGREQQRLESGVTSRGSEGKKKKKALFVPLSPLVALEFAFSNVEKARVYLSTQRVCINLIKRGACRSRERTVG